MAEDHFQAKLRCTHCGREGTAKLVENDGAIYLFGDKTTRVESLPEGFAVIERASKIGTIDFECADHPGSAVL